MDAKTGIGVRICLYDLKKTQHMLPGNHPDIVATFYRWSDAARVR